MPNGTPGDHLLTDILIHKVACFSPAVDSLIVEIISLGGRGELESTFDLLNPPPVQALEAQLLKMRDQLKVKAKERGWEVR